MTDKSAIAALKERVKKATGPDRELDRDIHAAIDGWEKVWNEQFEFFQLWKDGKWIALGSIPTYTDSIDASLALVERLLPGCWYIIAKGRITEAEPLFGCELLREGSHDDQLAIAEGSTPALAILSALLSALGENQ